MKGILRDLLLKNYNSKKSITIDRKQFIERTKELRENRAYIPKI
jgi:hypothetical protein